MIYKKIPFVGVLYYSFALLGASPTSLNKALISRKLSTTFALNSAVEVVGLECFVSIPNLMSRDPARSLRFQAFSKRAPYTANQKSYN